MIDGGFKLQHRPPARTGTLCCSAGNRICTVLSSTVLHDITINPFAHAHNNLRIQTSITKVGQKERKKEKPIKPVRSAKKKLINPGYSVRHFKRLPSSSPINLPAVDRSTFAGSVRSLWCGLPVWIATMSSRASQQMQLWRMTTTAAISQLNPTSDVPMVRFWTFSITVRALPIIDTCEIPVPYKEGKLTWRTLHPPVCPPSAIQVPQFQQASRQVSKRVPPRLSYYSYGKAYSSSIA